MKQTPNKSLAKMMPGTVKANLTGYAAAPQDVTAEALAAAVEPYLAVEGGGPHTHPTSDVTGLDAAPA